MCVFYCCMFKLYFKFFTIFFFFIILIDECFFNTKHSPFEIVSTLTYMSLKFYLNKVDVN